MSLRLANGNENTVRESSTDGWTVINRKKGLEILRFFF